jgi:hypothetical protein
VRSRISRLANAAPVVGPVVRIADPVHGSGLKDERANHIGDEAVCAEQMGPTNVRRRFLRPLSVGAYFRSGRYRPPPLCPLHIDGRGLGRTLLASLKSRTATQQLLAANGRYRIP